jgi:hypothetical protein
VVRQVEAEYRELFLQRARQRTQISACTEQSMQQYDCRPTAGPFTIQLRHHTTLCPVPDFANTANTIMDGNPIWSGWSPLANNPVRLSCCHHRNDIRQVRPLRAQLSYLANCLWNSLGVIFEKINTSCF